MEKIVREMNNKEKQSKGRKKQKSQKLKKQRKKESKNECFLATHEKPASRL
jgi:hypothetical protein